MTTDEVLKKLLREKNIYPPSVQDSHYGDNAEMTRGGIIEKTLKEMGMLLPSGQYAQSSDEADFLSASSPSFSAGSRPTPQSGPAALSSTSTQAAATPATRNIHTIK